MDYHVYGWADSHGGELPSNGAGERWASHDQDVLGDSVFASTRKNLTSP